MIIHALGHCPSPSLVCRQLSALSKFMRTWTRPQSNEVKSWGAGGSPSPAAAEGVGGEGGGANQPLAAGYALLALRSKAPQPGMRVCPCQHQCHRRQSRYLHQSRYLRQGHRRFEGHRMVRCCPHTAERTLPVPSRREACSACHRLMQAHHLQRTAAHRRQQRTAAHRRQSSKGLDQPRTLAPAPQGPPPPLGHHHCRTARAARTRTRHPRREAAGRLRRARWAWTRRAPPPHRQSPWETAAAPSPREA